MIPLASGEEAQEIIYLPTALPEEFPWPVPERFFRQAGWGKVEFRPTDLLLRR